MPGPGFPPGVPRFPIRGGVPRPPMNVFQGRPRGNFRGRPMMHRGGPLRPRFHGHPMVGMQGEVRRTLKLLIGFVSVCNQVHLC